MADKKQKESEDRGGGAERGSEEKKPGGGGGGGAAILKSTPTLLGVVMLVEALVLFAGFKMFNSAPSSAHAADVGEDEHGNTTHGAALKSEKKKVMELNVLEFKAPNKQTGRLFLYDVNIYVTVKTEFKERVEAAFKDRDATIRDRVRTIISQSDPEKLGGGTEPGLETLRRQVKHQLDEIIGEGMIEEVLIPRCIPYRQDF